MSFGLILFFICYSLFIQEKKIELSLKGIYAFYKKEKAYMCENIV